MQSGPPGPSALLEIVTHQRLMPSLRVALQYALATAAQRYPNLLLRLHALQDEVWLALRTLLEAYSLATHDCSFSEHFYFMRRVFRKQPPHFFASWLRRLPKRQRLILEVMLLVLPGYLRVKFESLFAEEVIYNNNSTTRQGSQVGDQRAALQNTGALIHNWFSVQQLEKISFGYRSVRVIFELGEFSQLLRFLFGDSPFSTLAQRLLGYELRRALTSQQVHRERDVSSISWLLELPLQYARQLLLISVLGYRLVEWLHAPQNAIRNRDALHPPPPQPPPVLEAKAQVAVFEPGKCPLCGLLPMEKPTAAPSGFVFCGRCILSEVRRERKCPLTNLPTTPAELVRLYENTN